VLELEFANRVYQYLDVPGEEYAAFLGADSKGTYLNQQLKLRGSSSGLLVIQNLRDRFAA